ncbi:unnamed protein product [Linum trigynum]|uniref:Uncharacterized protein n=1 Tax=Linum trigynum TaxID=586398 RepID=A0AAV2FCE1_9ROSI
MVDLFGKREKSTKIPHRPTILHLIGRPHKYEVDHVHTVSVSDKDFTTRKSFCEEGPLWLLMYVLQEVDHVEEYHSADPYLNQVDLCLTIAQN